MPAHCDRFIRAAFTQRDFGGRRLAWLRCEKIRALLATGQEFNSNTLSKAAGCARKTISRDVRFLRNHGTPVAYDPVRNTFFLKQAA